MKKTCILSFVVLILVTSGFILQKRLDKVSSTSNTFTTEKPSYEQDIYVKNQELIDEIHQDLELAETQLEELEQSYTEIEDTIKEGRAYKTYVMEVTAYDLSYASCGKYPDHPEYGVTASGKKIGEDIFEEDGIIASPPEFPFGTKMEVPFWGTGTVWDRGGAIKWNEEEQIYHLDIFISDGDLARAWGRRRLEVKVFIEGEKEVD